MMKKNPTEEMYIVDVIWRLDENLSSLSRSPTHIPLNIYAFS